MGNPHYQEENPNDLRETIAAAMEKHSETPPNDETHPGDEVPPQDADDSSVNNEAPSGETPPGDEPPSGETPPSDKSGEKPGDKPAETPPSDKPGEKPAETPPTEKPTDKAPGTWSPVSREKWGKLDPDIKEQVWKREREASRALTLSAEARKFSSEFERRVQPYLGFIAAENSTPLDAMDSLMRMGAILRVGTEEQKVRLVADTITRFKVNLEALDSVLAGQSPQYSPQAAIQHAVESAVAPLRQQLTQQQVQQRTQTVAGVDAEIDAFEADPKNEFFNDVKHLIPDILELAARQGKELSLTQAYERAIMLHDPVRQVIETRKRNAELKARSEAASRRKNAASSVTSSQQANQLLNPVNQVDNIRADIEAAMAAQQGR